MRYVTSIERLAKEEGLEQGLEQGREQGMVQGQLKVLKRLLARRFGDLPGRSLTVLEKAGPEDLERWTDRVLDANSLDEVFAAP